MTHTIVSAPLPGSIGAETGHASPSAAVEQGGDQAVLPSARNCIVYDGECPFCSHYVKFMRLREALGPVALVNARDGGAVVERLRSLGYNLDQGMVLILDGAIYHGHECIHRLALLTSPSGLFNRANAFIFRSRAASRVLYPVLRQGRLLTLFLLGRKTMDTARQTSGTKRFRPFRKQMMGLFLVLFAYALVAESVGLRIAKTVGLPHSHGEVFPFFTWSLFSRPYRYSSAYTIEPLEVEDDSPFRLALGRSLNANEAPFLRDIRFSKTVRALTWAIAERDESKIAHAQALLSNHVRPHGVKRYLLIRHKVDALSPEQRVGGASVVAEIDASRNTMQWKEDPSVAITGRRASVLLQ